MAKALEKTGKTVEEAIQSALLELGCSKEQVECEILEQPSKGFLGLIGAKPARVKVTVKEMEEKTDCMEKEISGTAEDSVEIAEEEQAPASETDVSSLGLERAEKFLSELFLAMNIEVKMNGRQTEDGYVFELAGKEIGVLIGKHGQTLDSLQYLVNLAANRGMTEDRVRIILDVENYRSRREETLNRLANRLAEKAVRMRQSIKLEPMNRHERKIIHVALQDNHRVITTSEGDEPYRYIVIVPKRGGNRFRERSEEIE